MNAPERVMPDRKQLIGGSDVADGWWQTHMDLLDQLQDDGTEIGLDKAGQIHVITPPEAA